MPSEPDNLPMGGTDNASSTDLDNPANLDFYDPAEEQDNVEEQAQGTEPQESTDEAIIDDGQESTDETQEAETDEIDPVETANIQDDTLVDVNGTPLPIKELKNGYVRQSDYTRGKQELSNKRRDLDAVTERVSQAAHSIAEYLSSQVPPAPDQSTAMLDPGRYVRERAMHEAAMQKVSELLSNVDTVGSVRNKLTQEQLGEQLVQEKAKLVEAFPHLSKQEEHDKFFETAFSTARELGYSDEEMSQATDHRLFKLAHYAKLGMEAEKARSKAISKTQNVPPVAPPRRPQTLTNAKARANQEAMKTLKQTGSIYDALKIDFT